MTLGTRLTLWHASLLGVLLAVFAAVSYRTLDRSLRADLDRALRERADHAALAVQAVPNLRLSGLSPGLAAEFASPGIYVQILDEAGRIVARSANLDSASLPVHADRLSEVLEGRSLYETAFVAGQNVRLYHRPVLRDGRVAGAVEVGGSLHNLEDALARLRRIFAVSIAVVLLVGAAGGHWLTRLGLRPLARLTQIAGRIQRSQDLGARIPHTGPPDEVGRLTLTLNQMFARLQAAFDAQRDFIAEAAHEMRTPLTSLLGNADLLALYGADPDRQAAALDAIQAEGRRTARLLSDLLVSAQADAGWRLDFRPIPIAEVLHAVVQHAHPLAAGVAICLDEPPPVLVRGDADRLKQVFLNLVDNALRHTPRGVVSIQSSVVSMERHSNGALPNLTIDDPGPPPLPHSGIPATRTPPHPHEVAGAGWLLVTVSDTGEGIPPESLPRLFERFYRVPGKSRGAGLGLSIARWIVEQHGGQIEVESQVGRGSEFRVWLPIGGMQPRSTSPNEDAQVW